MIFQFLSLIYSKIDEKIKLKETKITMMMTNINRHNLKYDLNLQQI